MLLVYKQSCVIVMLNKCRYSSEVAVLTCPNKWEKNCSLYTRYGDMQWQIAYIKSAKIIKCDITHHHTKCYVLLNNITGSRDVIGVTAHHVALMTIKGRLCVKILSRTIFVENFLSSCFSQNVHFGVLFRGWLLMLKFLTPKGTPLSDTASFEPSCVKIHREVWPVVYLPRSSTRRGRICTKFGIRANGSCTGHNQLRQNVWLRSFDSTGGRILAFSVH